MKIMVTRVRLLACLSESKSQNLMLDTQFIYRYIQGKTTFYQEFDFYSKNSHTSSPQYRLIQFSDSHLSKSLPHMPSHGGTQCKALFSSNQVTDKA